MTSEGSGFGPRVVGEGRRENAKRHAPIGAPAYRPVMRLVLTVLVLLSFDAAAKCGKEWFDSAPKAGIEVPPNAHVLVTLGGDQDTAPKLEFVAGPQTVAVTVVHTFFGMSQHLLLVKPVSPLPPGTWELVLELPKKTPVTRRFGPWKVTKESDSTAPFFTSTPALESTNWQKFACGPGSTIDLDGVTANETVFVEAAVTVDGKTRTAVLYPKDDYLALGHGMCSGAFALKPGTRATVVVTPIDLAGNRGAASAPIAFTAPGPTK